VAKFSTASLGKFQDNLTKEKQAKNIRALLPSSRKKKPAPPTPVEERKSNLDILDSILSKKPKLDVDKAVNRVLDTEQRK
jgi:regulator of ribosome biosynthesis